MRKWIKEHRQDPKVKAWLKKHPPPPEWEGSRMEYAYTEMPQVSSVLIVGGIAAAGTLLAYLLWRRQAPPAPTLALPEIRGTPLQRVARQRYGG